MDTRIWNQVGLELVQIDVEGPIETERCGDGGNNFGLISSFPDKTITEDAVTDLEQSNG